MTEIQTEMQRIKTHSPQFVQQPDLQKTIIPFERDSIASAQSSENVVKSVRTSISSAYSWIYNLIYGESVSVEQSNGKPVISPATLQEEKARESFIKEITEMQKRISSLDDDYHELLNENPKNSEALIAKLLSMAIRRQLLSKEYESAINLEKIETDKKQRQNLHEKHQQIYDSLESAEYKNNILSKVDTAVAVVCGGLALATTGVFAAGIAGVVGVAPFTPIISSAIASKISIGANLTKAATTMISGHAEGSLENLRKKDYIQKELKRLADEGINVSYKDFEAAMNKISSTHQLLNEVAERRQQASLQMFNKN